MTGMKLMIPEGIIHLFNWEKTGDEKKGGRDIQQTGSSLLHGFLLSVCHLEG